MKSAQILSVSVDQLDKHAIETQFEMQTNRFSLSVITQEAQNDQDTTITEEQVGKTNFQCHNLIHALKKMQHCL